MNATPPRPRDYWRVNSYGYPSVFSDAPRAQEAWVTLQSFFEFESYSKLKLYWSSGAPARQLSSHAVESWKATFEEFGLLYVISRSDRVVITPAGEQLRNAAEIRNENEFARIGLTLLFRYPLRGPRRPKSVAHETSDLLLYRFLFSAMRDLNDYFWWAEFERILCRVFLTVQTPQAISDVRYMRANPGDYTDFTRPADRAAAGFYNSLNQVVVHAGMNHLLLGSDSESDYYGDEERRRRHFIRPDWLPLVRHCLGEAHSRYTCDSTVSAVSRLPTAPSFDCEQEYFDYLGAKVDPLPEAGSDTEIAVLSLAGEQVAVLREGLHFAAIDADNIRGGATILCQIARGQRLILSTDERWTYLVEFKELGIDDSVILRIRRGRPISDFKPIRELLESADD